MIERYEDGQVALVFNPVAQLQRWLAVEVAQMQRIRGKEAADRLHRVGLPDLARMQELELSTGHEVVAFLRALDERICETGLRPGFTRQDAQELRQWLHFGLTSSDVIDTAQALALVAVHDYLVALEFRLVTALSAMCDRAAKLPTVIGRTHGQHAVPMPADHRWRVLYGMMVDCHRGLTHSGEGIRVGKLSGPVGAGPDESGEAVALHGLGLRGLLCSQIVPRDGLARWAQALANLGTVCEAIAAQVWLLAQTEIGELRELRMPAQVGSSAMPHKQNPARSENIRGLARLVRMYAGALDGGIVQWGEHDLAHSSVERVVIPDLCHVIATILVRTSALVSGLELESRPLSADYVDTHAELMMRQRGGQPYVEAHAELMSLPYLGGTLGE